MNTKTLLTLVITLMPIFFFGQKPEMKFGKISKEELEMEYYEHDSSANAVVLYDYGKIDTDYKLSFDRHKKIKILKEEGKRYADIIIPLFKGGSATTNLASFKAVTYNIENGEIVKNEIKFKDLIFEKTYDYITTVKGTFPNVKEGSVLEIKYTLQRNSIGIPSWYFQYDKIPVKYSEFSVLFPEYYKMHIDIKGFADIDTHFFEGDGNTVEEVKYQWYAENIPAFEVEEYTSSTNNYKKRIDFELSHVKYRGITYYDAASNWDEVDKKLNESPYFGERINNSFYLKKINDSIIVDTLLKYEKLLAIYKYLQNELKFSGYESKYAYRTFREGFKKKLVSSADINIALLSLLRINNIYAEPVLLSTRKNGKIYPHHPTSEKFNYVIAKVIIGENVYYVDATDELLPIGLLPKRCFNGLGRVINKRGSNLFEISPTKKDKSVLIHMFKIEGDMIKGNVNKTFYDYSAYDKRKEIEEIGDIDDYSKYKIKISSKEIITDYKITDFEDIYKPLKESYNITTTDNITFTESMIYLSPLLDEALIENPFKLEDRKYPIDYGYPILKKIIMQYTIPEGYTIEEKPENVSFTLPDKAAQFQYQVAIVGDKLQVISIFKINHTIFQYDSYKALKNFYNLVIEKQNEKIVLKKIK